MGLNITAAQSKVAEFGFASAKKRATSTKGFLGLILGPSHTGKTASFSTIPKGKGKKHYILSFDESTINGIIGFQTPIQGSPENAEEWVDENIAVAELAEYWDSTDVQTAIATAEYIKSAFDAVVEDAKAGKVAMVAVEHYEVLQRKIGVDLCRASFNVPRGKKLNYMKHYGPRTQLLEYVDGCINRLRSITDGVWMIGYGPQFEDQSQATEQADGGQRVDIVKVLTDPDWVKNRSFAMNSNVRIETERSIETKVDGGGTPIIKPTYRAVVTDGRHAKFPIGRVVDATGVGLAPLFEGWYKPQARLDV